MVLFGTNPRARQARKVSDMCGVIPVVLIGLRDHFETKQLLSLRAKSALWYCIVRPLVQSRHFHGAFRGAFRGAFQGTIHAKPAGNNRRFNPQSTGGRPEGRGFGPSTGWDPPPKASSKGGASHWLKRVMETQIPSRSLFSVHGPEQNFLFVLVFYPAPLLAISAESRAQ